MNIVRALEVALPDLPERVVRESPPKLDPRVISKEHVEKGQAVVLVKMPGTDVVFRLPPSQWKLVQLFDGKRSFAEIAEQYGKETGSRISEDEVQELASQLQSETPLMYKTQIEKNITLQQELRSSRSKRKKSNTIDFSDIVIKVWHDADGYITRLYPKVRFLFTPWFVWTSIGMFVLMAWMWAARFGEIWSDSFAFYNFTSKSAQDLVEFWFLFGTMAAVHETAHGLAGKHFGATVEKMGFTLMYFAPSFFCDATQVWVLGGKWARIAVALAGIWLDLIICFLATVLWWGTPVGMSAHDWAYKVMMVTGLGVSLLNLNPLIKLDGYLIFSELVQEPSLKETSTAYLSGWIRRNIFRLPAEVPYVPRRKRAFLVVYAILSGLYSYLLLSFLMIFTYHILRSFTPEWAFLPAIAAGVWVFRSRINLGVEFMKMVYLDKKDRVRAWFTAKRVGFFTVLLACVLLLPIWPEYAQGPFLLDAGRTAILHATVPGTVSNVLVREGQHVAAGTPLLQLRNLELASQVAHAHAELASASDRATQAGLRYTDFGAAEQERQHKVVETRVLEDKLAQLEVTSPIAGTVITPRMADLEGRSLDEGDFLMQVADTLEMQARVYIPEFEMHNIRIGQRVRLLPTGSLFPISGTLAQISPASTVAAEGLLPKGQLEGLNPPRYYLGIVWLHNPGSLLPGMTGTAKVLLRRQSLAASMFRFGREFLDRKIW